MQGKIKNKKKGRHGAERSMELKVLGIPAFTTADMYIFPGS